MRSVGLISIQDLMQQLRKLDSTVFNETETLRRLLQHNPVDVESLAPYLTWDRQHYTRNLIDRTPLYELMAICWEVGQASSVHNHRDQNCWMAVPMGRLRVENLHLVRQDLERGTCHLEPLNTLEMSLAEPCAVNPADPVHRVINPREFNQRAVSLHVYSRERRPQPRETLPATSPQPRPRVSRTVRPRPAGFS